jgi:hypothetical protein
MGDLRGMTAQIQRELEATRAELRRGVVELPQETQETTAQMRRVVADQIKALNELASLVSRSNRVVDAAPPVAQPRRVNEAVAAVAVAEPARPAPQEVRPAPAMPAAAAPVQATARFAPAEPAAPPRAEPAPVRRVDPPARENGNGNGRGGWLSDLLTRASRDEGQAPVEAPRAAQPQPQPQRSERTRANSLESLDSISVDIARMIDHDAAVELWDRYKRGERNVFTRRLYTLQGQQTFDEIRRKYRSDTEFRQTVDRYVSEFERLIAEVSRDDRDSVLARTYLTSETGKVYTMLAHASGRLE